jgi:hypothetical protein
LVFLATFLLQFQGNFEPWPTISPYSKAPANRLKTFELQFAQQIFKLLEICTADIQNQ